MECGHGRYYTTKCGNMQRNQKQGSGTLDGTLGQASNPGVTFMSINIKVFQINLQHGKGSCFLLITKLEKI